MNIRLFFLSLPRILGLALFLLSLPAAFAVDATAGDRRIKFSFYSHGRQAIGSRAAEDIQREMLELQFETVPGEVEGLTLAPGNQSKVFEYTGPSTIRFFKEYTSPDGELLRQPLCSALIPSGMTEVLLVGFSRNEGQAEGMRIIPIDVSEQAIPRGNVRIYNVSSVPLACSVFNQKEVLQPLDSMQVAIENSQLPAQFAIREGEDWTLVYSQTRTVRKSRRYAFLMIPTEADTGYRMLRLIL